MSRLVRSEVFHCVGESHCLRFSDLGWLDDGAVRSLVTRVHFLTDVTASNFSGNGGLHSDLSAALLGGGLCTEVVADDGCSELVAAHRRTTFASRVLAARHAALADQPLEAPPLLWFAGDKELHSLTLEMGEDVDFELPADPGFGRQPGARRVPYEDVEVSLRHLLRPFLDGLEMLTGAGFTRSLVHGLAPRSGNLDRIARWCSGVRIPASLRSKVAIVANRLLQRRCAELGLGFVDVWSELVGRDGLLDPRFDLDGIHLTRAATEVTFPAVAAALAGLGGGGANPKQYELLAELAVVRTQERAEVDADFERLGWSAIAGVVHEDPRDAESLHACVGKPAVRHAIERGFGFEVGVVVAARVSAFVPATAPVESLAAVRCAVLVPGDKGEVRCIVRSATGSDTEAVLAAGSLLVFDPMRIVGVSFATGLADVWQLVMLARLPGEALQVLIAEEVWPPDPFHVRGVVADGDPGSALRRWREVEGKTVLVPRPDTPMPATTAAAAAPAGSAAS